MVDNISDVLNYYFIRSKLYKANLGVLYVLVILFTNAPYQFINSYKKLNQYTSIYLNQYLIPKIVR